MSTTVSPETPRQLKDRQPGALRGSIGKWTLIVDSLKHSRDFVDRGGVDCACCVEFFQSDNGVNCEKCPIRLDTGKGFVRIPRTMTGLSHEMTRTNFLANPLKQQKRN